MTTINLQLVQLVAVFAAVLLSCSRAEPAAVEVEKGSGDTDFFPADLEPEDPMSEELVNESKLGKIYVHYCGTPLMIFDVCI